MTSITPRQRVQTALQHIEPDRVPVDFLATTEIWHKVVQHLELTDKTVDENSFFDPAWEAVLQYFAIDCRLLSYDQFCTPPASVMQPGARVEWWEVLTRSTPNRMWRQFCPDGTVYDIWGRPLQIVDHTSGQYEGDKGWALQDVVSLEDVKQYRWPEPDWWDFSPLPAVIKQLDAEQESHLRFRIGSVFETAWQLRGMEDFLMDLVRAPELAIYIMERLTEILLENTRRVLEIAHDRLDMIYFYDDVATQNSLMVSPKMWHNHIKPLHAQLIDMAKSYNVPVMYHCDGAIYPLISELIELGVDLLNPIQPDAKNMEPERLKTEFGDKLSFHGGIDIIETLPRGTPEDVIREVKDRVQLLGKGGGYVLASSHHIQPDTPLENVLAMYEVDLRYRNGE